MVITMKNLFDKFIQVTKSKWTYIYVPAILLAVFFYLITFNNVHLDTYEIERFDRAKETIRSPISVENESETERKTRESVQAVTDRYSIIDDIKEERLSYVDEFIDAIDTVKSEAKSTEKKSDEETLSLSDQVKEVKDILADEITSNVSDDTILAFLELDEKNRDKGLKVFTDGLQATLDSGVRIENIQTSKEELNSLIGHADLSKKERSAFQGLTDLVVVENSFFDMEKTMAARNEAASNVEPVMIRAGDVIAREGQIITNEIYEDLQLVGLLKQQQNLFPAIGLALFVLLMIATIIVELNRLYNRKMLNFNMSLIIISSSFIVISMMKVFSLFIDQLNYLYFVAPIAVGVLLIKVLAYERLSIIFAVIYSILGAIIFNGELPGVLNIEAGIYFLIFQFAAIFSLNILQDRMTLFKSTVVMALCNLVTIMIFMFLSYIPYSMTLLLVYVVMALTAAILSTVLTIGLLPFFETTLGILSDNRLLALANPNQKLLKKLLNEAPGTYHHSIMVANLSETACEAIGANGLLARVGAYYHDIGKTVKPNFFIENQVAIQNPHDFLPPEDSAKIIIDHVNDGVKMLEEADLPKEIIDIAKQHHGTSLVEYFYYQAKQKDDTVEEKDFRYPGPVPLTKEAAVISICDSVEAAVRSLKEPSPEKIDEIVHAIIQKRLIDGQFNESPITVKEINLVHQTVCDTLKGIFHSRIQYPSEEDKK